MFKLGSVFVSKLFHVTVFGHFFVESHLHNTPVEAIYCSKKNLFYCT